MHPCHQHNQIVGLKQLVNCYNKNGGRLICFPVESDSIEVIKDPKSFHNKLKVNCINYCVEEFKNYSNFSFILFVEIN